MLLTTQSAVIGLLYAVTITVEVNFDNTAGPSEFGQVLLLQ